MNRRQMLGSAESLARLRQRILPIGERSAHELAQRRSNASRSRLEKKLKYLVEPDAPADARVPPHRMPIVGIAMEQHAPKDFRTRLHQHFDRFEPQEHPPSRYAASVEDLMLVVPASQIELQDLSSSTVA